jgi:hypothetical protein
MLDEYGRRVALEYALRSRDRHGVQIGGLCGHCGTLWPCEAFWIAHHAVIRLRTALDTPGHDDR